MCNKISGYIQKSLIKFALLSKYKPIMWFNKLFNTFLIKYYCVIINTLHHKHTPKVREGSFMRREGSYVLREGSSLRREGSYVLREGSSLRREGSFMRREGSSLRREGSFMRREGSYLLREGSYLLREGSSLIKEAFFRFWKGLPALKDGLILTMKLLSFINEGSLRKNDRIYIHIIHTLYKDEHKYWSESNYYT